MKNIAYLLIPVAYFLCAQTVDSLSAHIWNEIAKAADENRTFVLENVQVPQLNNSNLNLDPDLERNECEHECVPYYLCRNGTININGTGIIDVRLGANTCSDLFEVCCRPSDVSPVNLRAPPPPPPPTTAPGCGLRRPHGLGVRVIGDELNESQIGEFPWMVAVMTRAQPPRIKGGGALVSLRAVLTAAHSVRGAPTGGLLARAGAWDLGGAGQPLPPQEAAVEAVRVHPDFDPAWLHNDVALLLLERPLEMADNVGVVCLPSQGQPQPVESTRCIATGWGKDDFTRRAPPHRILKKLELPVVRRLSCQRSLRLTRLGALFRLHSSFLCAGGEEHHDMCSGDGGGPLVCPLEGQPGRYYQAGVVSWGIGCGEKGVPGVYVDVARFRGWIDRELEEAFGTVGVLDERAGFPGAH